MKGVVNYWDYHLNLGYYYVETDIIVKFETVDEVLNLTSVELNIPPERYIVCQNDELKNVLDENEKGWHHYIEIDGDKRISRLYNSLVETGYYERITWEKGIGLTQYISGYGAMREAIELYIIIE
jgi:hypothetical protein